MSQALQGNTAIVTGPIGRNIAVEGCDLVIAASSDGATHRKTGGVVA